MGAGRDIELRADEERGLVACGVVSGSQPWGTIRIETRVWSLFNECGLEPFQ